MIYYITINITNYDWYHVMYWIIRWALVLTGFKLGFNCTTSWVITQSLTSWLIPWPIKVNMRMDNPQRTSTIHFLHRNDILMDVPCTPRAFFSWRQEAIFQGQMKGKVKDAEQLQSQPLGRWWHVGHVGGSESHGEPQVIIPRNLAMDQ